MSPSAVRFSRTSRGALKNYAILLGGGGESPKNHKRSQLNKMTPYTQIDTHTAKKSFCQSEHFRRQSCYFFLQKTTSAQNKENLVNNFLPRKQKTQDM